MRGAQRLLLDEPVGALDEELKMRVLAYVGRIVEEWKVPTIYVTHNASEVKKRAQTVITLRDGRVDRCGPPGEILAPG